MDASASFQAFLTVTRIVRQYPYAPVRWTAWMDPGVHTGFAMVVYADPQHAAAFNESMAKSGIAGWPAIGQGPGAPAAGIPDLCNAALLAVHTELLTDSETLQVRTAVGRIRRLGASFPSADGDDQLIPGLGPALIGAESFINLRSERDRDYLSPVRVRSMFAYALEDEFGVQMDSQQPGDAKTAFSEIRMKRAGLYLPGPDHVRDALAHCLLAIRRNG